MPITASSGLIIAPAVGAPVVLTSSHLFVHDYSNNPANNAQLLVTVTAPPTHGALRLSGVASSQFTNADLLGGLVTYTSSDGADDNFTVFVRATTTPSVAKPYTPQFTKYSATMPTTDGGVYLATAMVGATTCPTTRLSSGFTPVGGVSNTNSWSVSLEANTVVVFGVSSSPPNGSGVSGPVTLTSVSATGLTLTHIGGGSVTTSTSEHASVWTTIDWYWAPVTTDFTSTVTATFSASFNRIYMFLTMHSFRGLASISAPWDTNASNLQSVSTGTGGLPATMTLTTDAPDHLVLPVFHEVVSLDMMPSGPDLLSVLGYDEITYVSGSFADLDAQVRASATASLHVHVSATAPPPTSSLAMDNLLAYAAVTTSQLVFLDWSDDRAHSWSNPVSQPIGDRGEYRTVASWNRLGYARDRVYRLTWSVPVATALQGAFLEIDARAKT